ncbi:phospholipid carrier-dependent glycosyltransferase [Holophaga foetida]|uniref:phospholipid carrier-dependent glycosyltransferase n=1 Tax=Holophaga foetida TaxID=35839 RepID=UPI0002472EEA|nr:phospholipid carrier-dependent glycosyltransferase [Holophaga foetida]
MTRTERWQYLGIWFFLGFVPLLMRSLWQPDEARYAEIPREMLASGDWLTPRLNYVLYFEKPPFQYWLSALSMKSFGLNAAAARLPLALATAISLWCAWRLARRLGARQPIWAVFMAATALIAYACGQILTLDALFSAFMVLALTAGIEAVVARCQERSALGWTLLAFGSLALAVLTKGLAAPVLLGGTFICTLPWAWKERPLRRALLRTFFHPLGWILLLLISVPWFVVVDRANPGHAQFFFVHEHFKRFTTHEHARQGSKNPVLDKLYFVLLLVPGLMPWLTTCLSGLGRSLGFLRRNTGPQSEDAPLHRWVVAALLMGILVPLAFFSLSGSKLPPYILPVVVPFVALAVGFAREARGWSARMGWETLALGLAFLVAALLPRLIKDKSQVEWVFVLALAYIALGLWALRPRGLTPPRLMAALGALCLLLTWTVNHALGSSKALDRLTRRAPANAQWISAGNYFQILPFISRSPVTIVSGTGELEYGMQRLEPEERDRRFYRRPRELNKAALRMQAEQPDRPVWALLSVDIWTYIPENQRSAWELVDQSPAALLLRLR